MIEKKKTRHIKKTQPFKAAQIVSYERKNDSFLYIAILLLITLISFSSSLNNSFTNWDDQHYIVENPLIRSLSFENIFKIFSPSSFSGLYHPITMLSLAVNFKIGNLNPFGYILFNLLLHLFSTWFVFILANKLFKNNITAFICALLFGIHPMHVEPVAMISNRKDVLFTFFYLSSLIVYLKYFRQDVKNKILKYITALILFILSLLSKPTAVTLPAVMFLFDFFDGRKFTLKLILEKIPFIIIAAAIIPLEMNSQKNYGAVSEVVSFIETQRRFIVCFGYDCIFYLVRFFIPVKLSAVYPYFNSLPETLPLIYYLAFFGVIVLIGLDLYLLKKNKIVFLGLTFFLLTISTNLYMRFVSASCAADRYTYIPYIGLSFIVAFYFEKLLSGTYFKEKRKVLITTGVLIIFVLSCSTFARCKVWKNSEILFTDVIKKYPDISIPYNNRGIYYVDKGLFKEAIQDYTKAIDLDPKYKDAYYNRAIAYMNIGNATEAIKDYTNAIMLNPHFTEAYINRGNAYKFTGKPEEAIVDYSKAIELNPNFTEAYNTRGIAYKSIGRLDNAINDYNKALELNPNYTDVYVNRGIAYSDKGVFDDAIRDLNKAVELNPNFTNAYYIRGNVYKAKGNPNEAIKDFNKTIEQYPNEAIFYHKRGECFEKKGLLKERDADFKKYEELSKNNMPH